MQTGYGLGFMVERRGGVSYVGHRGGVAGYRAAMHYDRARKLGVIVFHNVVGNKQDPGRLAKDILAMLLARKGAEH